MGAFDFLFGKKKPAQMGDTTTGVMHTPDETTDHNPQQDVSAQVSEPAMDIGHDNSASDSSDNDGGSE